MDKTTFVLVTIAVPVFVWVALARRGLEVWAPWAAVPLWGVLVLGSGSTLDDIKVPFGAELVSHPHSPDELAGVVVALYVYGFGVLKVVIAGALGAGAALYVTRERAKPSENLGRPKDSEHL